MLLSEMLPVISPRFFPKSITSPSISDGYSSYNPFLKRSSRRRLPPRGAVEKEEPQLEFDRKKALEALQKLDQQLESLAEQQTLPKTRLTSSYSEPNLERDVIPGMRSTEELPEISGSYLAYSAVALLILTIFNNIVFNAFIKPSVDGSEQVSTMERVPLSEP